MLVYRICGEWEVKYILEHHDFGYFGYCGASYGSNNHKYDSNARYLHFFLEKSSVIYHNFQERSFVCTYDIPDDILARSRGIGMYDDINCVDRVLFLDEFAIKVEDLKVEFLKKIEVLYSNNLFQNTYNFYGFDSFMGASYEDSALGSR